MGEISREEVAAATGGEGGDKPDGGGQKPVFQPKQEPAQPAPEGPSKAAGSPPEAPSAPEPGQPAPEGQPSAPDLDAFSFPDHESVPELLRGKKGSEAVKAYNTLYNTSKQMAQYLRDIGNRPPQPPQPAQPAKEEPLLTSDDFISGDPSTIEGKLGQLFERKAQPLLLDIYRGMTIQTMNSARSSLPHFTKYETEIMQELAQTPINVTAHFQTWKDAHDRVVARHIDEIAAERGRNRPPPPVTERGSGEVRTPETTVELDTDDIKIADGLGVDRRLFARMKEVYAGKTGEV